MAPRKPTLVAVPDPPERPAPPDLRDAVKAALDEMAWLSPSDRALAALALRAAEEIEAASDKADELDELYGLARGDADLIKRLQKLEAKCELTKLVGWLGPQLQGYLRDLGGTPAARKAMQADKPVGGRLAQLRADAASREASKPAGPPPARKSAARRPAKRDDPA